MKIVKISCICFLAATLFLLSCTTEEVIEQVVVAPAEATLAIDARVGSEDFALNQDFTIGGAAYRFEKLRYWISNIVLTDEKGTEYAVPDAYFLMEEVGNLDLTGTISDQNIVYPANKREEIVLTKLPAGSYNSVRFSVGVDARRNDNLSLQAGELSIANGMSNISWMWHTSYIFSSIGGKVSSETTEPVTFLAETGLNENYKTVSVSLSSPLRVEAGSSPKLSLNFDVAKVLEGVNLLETPVIGARQPEAMKKISDNFSESAFTFVSIE